jgi:hypothetical protein
MREHLTGLSILGKLEAEAVRKPAALMFLKMLREMGYDKKHAKSPDEIYYVAKEMTDHYMVSTKWYEKPHMFSRTGLVGTATSPLQSFATTWVGMLREYAHMSKAGLLEGSVAKQLPLAAFLGMNLVTAGVIGLVGVKEWDAIAGWLNRTFGYNIMTGTEFMLSNVKSTKYRFGLLADAIGMNIGATFNAPTLTGSFMPGVQGIGNAANALVTGGKALGAKMGITSAPTSVEMRDALKGVSPRFSPIPGVNWGDIEKQFTPEGMPYQDTKGNAGPVTRDDFDHLARRLGTYSLKEATSKTEEFLKKRKSEERSQRLSKAINRSVDTLLVNPDKFMEVFDKEISKIEADGHSGDDIKNALKREIMAKIVESDDKQMMGKATSKKAYLLELMEQLR